MTILVRTTSGSFETSGHPGLTALALVNRAMDKFSWLGTALDYQVTNSDGHKYDRDEFIRDTTVFVTSVHPVDA